MAGWLQVLKSHLSHFSSFNAFLWNAVYLKKAGGVLRLDIASWVQHLFLSDGARISPWEVSDTL